MWTEQTVETLRKFAREGRSASWIAAALGAPSRNAVIGKANRIGIKLAGVRSEPHGATAAAAGTGESASATDAAPATRRASRPRVLPRAPAPGVKRRAGRRAFAHAEVGEMRRVGLAAIGETECRWPVGDPGEEGFVYCGLEVARGRAYCGGHCRLIYRLPNT